MTFPKIHYLDHVQCAQTDAVILGNFSIGDEKWMYGYEPETKAQPLVWKSASFPQLKSASQV